MMKMSGMVETSPQAFEEQLCGFNPPPTTTMFFYTHKHTFACTQHTHMCTYICIYFILFFEWHTKQPGSCLPLCTNLSSPDLLHTKTLAKSCSCACITLASQQDAEKMILLPFKRVPFFNLAFSILQAHFDEFLQFQCQQAPVEF